MSRRVLILPCFAVPCFVILRFLAAPGMGLAETYNWLTPAPNAQIVTVSLPGGHYSEPGIAINPRNPKQVVVVFQGARNVQGTATAAWSADGGKSFALAQGTGAADWKVLGDVTTTFDNEGSVYLCSIAFDRLGTSSYWGHGTGRNGIIVRRSRDAGRTWESGVSNVKTFSKGTERDISFEDEPRIYADNHTGSPHAGTLYVGWVEWQLTQSVMFFARSTDHAQTWSAPVRLSTRAGLPRDDNGGLAGFTQATAADGSIYAAWSDGNHILLTSSHDGGLHFAPSIPVLPTGPAYFGEVPGVARVSGFPTLAIDSRRGHPERLYLCWSDYSNGDVDVFVASSTDGGRSWCVPVRVNDDSLHNGADQFFPWMTLDPVTGDVWIDFYDRRSDPANQAIRLTLARSTDGGRTFRNYAFTTAPFRPFQAFLGDYTAIDAWDGHIVAAWTETTAKASRTNTETVIQVGTADIH